MSQAKSEIIINVLRHHFPQTPDSKLAKLLDTLQRGWGINKPRLQTPLTPEGEKVMPTTLLFVDDNRMLAETATKYMNEIRPQWRFLLAHTLAEARRTYDLYCPDAAVLDVGLPDGSGLDLLSEFKRNDPKLPVIMISGDDPMILHQAVIERGGYSFLPKPFSTPVLVSHIESAIAAFRDEALAQAEPRPETRGAWKNPHALALRFEDQKIEVNEPEDPRARGFVLK